MNLKQRAMVVEIHWKMKEKGKSYSILIEKRKNPIEIKLRLLLFSSYEDLTRSIWILESEIFQHVFEGFMGFLRSLDSKIQTA